MQQLVLMGTFFVVPVYLQVVLGLDAFETGKKLFPMSLSILIAALVGPKLAARSAPRHVVQIGLASMVLGALVMMGTIDVTLHGVGFTISMILFGVGAGLLFSQLGNVIMSSAPPEETNEAGGLQGTAQNLGASLGTALIGAILLTALTNGFVTNIQKNTALPQHVRDDITQSAAAQGLDVVPVSQVEQAAKDAGLPPDQAAAVAKDYADAQLNGLKIALLAVAFFAVLAFWFTRRLPGRAAETAPT